MGDGESGPNREVRQSDRSPGCESPLDVGESTDIPQDEDIEPAGDPERPERGLRRRECIRSGRQCGPGIVESPGAISAHDCRSDRTASLLVDRECGPRFSGSGQNQCGVRGGRGPRRNGGRPAHRGDGRGSHRVATQPRGGGCDDECCSTGPTVIIGDGHGNGVDSCGRVCVRACD